MPVMAARIMLPLMLTVDMFFAGGVSVADVGYLGLGIAPQMFITYLAIGSLHSVMILS